MENYRRSYGQEGFVGRSYTNRKPPLGFGKPTIPAWEKKFCKTVGSLNWNAFLEKKKYIHMYDNILEWNDSAGEEAFHSAKRRFWAEFNGCTCAEDIPDPELYIDEIDWECQIDEELLLDLDCRAVTDSDEKRDPVIIFGDSFIQNMPFFTNGWGTGWGEEMPEATGWGDEIPKASGCGGEMPKAIGWGEEIPRATGWEEEMPKATGWEEEMPKATGWEEEMPNATEWGGEMPNATGWGEEIPKATGWGYEEDIPKDHGDQWAMGWGDKENRDGDCPNNSWHLNKGDGQSSGYGNSQGMKREADLNNPKNRNSEYGGSWRRWDNNEAIRTRAGMSWNKSPRFHGAHNSNSSWKGRSQENYSWRQKNTGKIQPNGCWNSNASRPNTHQTSDNAAQRWNRKKQVS